MIIDTHLHWPMSAGTAPNDLLAMMDSAGIGAGVLCGLEVLFAATSAPAPQWNDRLIALCSQAPGRLVPLVTVHPAEGAAAVDEARRCIAGGCIGGFKLHPWLQGQSLRLPATAQLCELAGAHNLPVMLHDGTPPYSLCSQVAMLAGEHPRTTFILGHSGLLQYWREAGEVAMQFGNVYLTLCGGHPWGMARLCRQVPPDRLLWGSDALGPGNEEIIRYRLGLMDALGISAWMRESIMSGNARRLWPGLAGAIQ